MPGEFIARQGLISRGNVVVTGSLSTSGSFTTTGTITATTLVVQTITSSISSITGSTNFGSLLANTHTFTGSLNVTGGLAVTTTGVEFQVNPTGVNLGNALTDSHVISGSLRINSSTLIVSSSGNVGIGTIPNTTAGITELAIGSSNTNPLISGIRDGASAFALSSDSTSTLLNERRNLNLRFGSNNTERMRITSDGELLINATTNGAPNLGYQLGVRGTNANSLISIALANQTLSTQGAYLGLDGAVGYIHMIDNKPWIFSTNNTERMRITSGGNTEVRSGNVLNVYRTDNTRALQLYTTANECAIDSWEASSEPLMIRSNGSGGRITFHTNGAERMRLNSGGVILIGKTATAAFGTAGWQFDAAGTGLAVFSINNNEAFIFNNINTGTTYEIDFRTNAVERGKISVTDSGVSYATQPSDRNLKKNFEDWNQNVLDVFKNLNPQKFNFLVEDDSQPKTKGFIAQDLVESFPEAYPISKDRYFFNPSGMVVYLMKAIQELEARVQELENK
jgi:hypothetical protein